MIYHTLSLYKLSYFIPLVISQVTMREEYMLNFSVTFGLSDKHYQGRIISNNMANKTIIFATG